MRKPNWKRRGLPRPPKGEAKRLAQIRGYRTQEQKIQDVIKQILYANTPDEKLP